MSTFLGICLGILMLSFSCLLLAFAKGRWNDPDHDADEDEEGY